MDDPVEIEKRIQEVQRQKEELKKQEYALKIKRAAAIRDRAYGERKPLNVEIPVEDRDWLEAEAKRQDKFLYVLLHEAICLLREKVEGQFKS